MLGLLNDIEYNNAGALLGGYDDELLGALRSANPIQRQQIINKVAGARTPSRGSRAEMEKHFNELPAHIKTGLRQGDLFDQTCKQQNNKIVRNAGRQGNWSA
jgi:hypothetical protein